MCRPGVTNLHAVAVSTLANIPSPARARCGPPTNTQVLSLASDSTINLSPGDCQHVPRSPRIL